MSEAALPKIELPVEVICPTVKRSVITASSDEKKCSAVTVLLELMLPEAVRSPVKFKLSVNEIPATSPPADWKLSANTVPDALIFPVVVK